MKKIIALAVASAFVAPVMAAEVTVYGDIEYTLTDKDSVSGVSNGYGDSDIFVSASEDLGNGMSVKVVQGWEDINAAAANGDSELYISGDFGQIALGNVTAAGALYDEAAGVAEAGGAYADASFQESGELTATYTVAVMDGVTLALSAVFDNVDSSGSLNTTENVMHTSAAVNYSKNGLTAFYGSFDPESEGGETTVMKSTSVYGINYTTGPIFVAYQAIQDGVAGASHTSGHAADTVFDATTIGASYNYGAGKVFFETNSSEVDGVSDKEETIMGISYKIGAVNLYVQGEDANAARGNDDATVVGVDYAF